MANNSAIQVARKEIVGLLESQKAQITMALPKHLTADRICRVAITEMGRNPKLFECTPISVLASIVMAAQLGLEPGVNGQCYLVPYKGVCQLIPGWQGFVDLISRSGRASVWTGAVRDGDRFEYTLGSSPVLNHTPGDEDGGEFTHAYAVGWVKGAQWPVIEVWSRAKVKKHLNTYNKVGDRHYALQGENNLEMYGRKVALLQVMKYMPKSVEMVQAQTLEYRGGEGLQSLTFKKGGVTDAEYMDISGGEPEEDKQSGNDKLKGALKANASQPSSHPATPAATPTASEEPSNEAPDDEQSTEAHMLLRQLYPNLSLTTRVAEIKKNARRMSQYIDELKEEMGTAPGTEPVLQSADLEAQKKQHQKIEPKSRTGSGAFKF